MASLSPDALYARLPSDFLWMIGVFARSRPQARFIYALAHDLHARAWSAYDYRKWFHAPLYGMGLRSAHAIAIQHQGQATLISQRLRNRLYEVPNLTQSSRVAPRDPGAAVFDVIWIAKIRLEKRLDLLLELAGALPDRRFAVIGGFDPLMPADACSDLERRAESLPNVTLLGPKRADEVLALIALSRVLVNTSDSEGFPNSMLEAWSCGVPVVSLSVDPGGVIVREGMGFVAGNADTLRERVQTLILDRTVNWEMGNRGLGYINRNHSPGRAINALLRAAHAAETPPVLSDSIETTGNTPC
jgi:glycosyltransferase involved in cell wall biosynthesis